MWFSNLRTPHYLVSTDATVRTFASGAGAACTYNVYADNSLLYESAIALGNSSYSFNNIPNTSSISELSTVSARITAVGGVVRPKDLQIKLYLVPQYIYLGA